MSVDTNLEGKPTDNEQTGNEQENEKVFPESVVKKLREENASWRSKLRENEKRLQEMETKVASVDTEKYFEMLDKEKNKEREEMEKKGQWEKIKQEMIETHQKELSKFNDEINTGVAERKKLEAELNATILNNQIAVEASKAECLNPAVLQLILAQEAKVEVTDSGKRVVKIYDDDGEVRINAKTGNQFNIADRISEMKEDMQYAMLFRGSKVGAGSQSSANGEVTGNPFKSGPHYNLTEQGRLIKEQPDLAKRLAKEAGITITI